MTPAKIKELKLFEHELRKELLLVREMKSEKLRRRKEMVRLFEEHLSREIRREEWGRRRGGEWDRRRGGEMLEEVLGIVGMG